MLLLSAWHHCKVCPGKLDRRTQPSRQAKRERSRRRSCSCSLVGLAEGEVPDLCAGWIPCIGMMQRYVVQSPECSSVAWMRYLDDDEQGRSLFSGLK